MIASPQNGMQVGAIIVSPTRELAKQIHTVVEPFLQSLPGISSLLLVGGTYVTPILTTLLDATVLLTSVGDVPTWQIHSKYR